jgi:CheY-like chemotaxis protein
MTDKTILVIDDSATIRKLVDSHLSPLGYQVVLAPTAEDGLRLAAEVVPDLILLDHQLPGTTGYEVCCKLVEHPELQRIPVVISSTLRKKAYAEYIDLDNVVDMLPKPYSDELLCTTVANALETASMVVSSQSQGTAVPEVIDQPNDSALSGSLTGFGLRELLDFLNNGRKCGVLQVEGERVRIRFHLDKGRIQAVYAAGIAPAEVEQMAKRLPKSLVNLAPILKLTISGRSCAEVDGFVQLLDQKVLDPRLMTKLLRFQAALLVRSAFTRKLTDFRFESGSSSNALHKNLPLDISLLALLVEGAIYSDSTDTWSEQGECFARRAVRGQNLDRAGLAARHMKVLNVLSEPRTIDQLVELLGWDEDEVRQVFSGFVMADLVEPQFQSAAGQFLIYEPDPQRAQRIREQLDQSDSTFSGQVVRDRLALQLVLKRAVPHTIAFSVSNQESCRLMKQLFASKNPKAANVKRIAMLDQGQDAQSVEWIGLVGFYPHQTIHHPFSAAAFHHALEELFDKPPTAAGEDYQSSEVEHSEVEHSEVEHSEVEHSEIDYGVTHGQPSVWSQIAIPGAQR